VHHRTGVEEDAMLGAGRTQQLYDVRVELGGPATDEELCASLRGELGADPAGWLGELEPQVGTTDRGRAAVRLKIPGHDVWGSVLTALAVLRQLGYDPLALHVESAQAHLLTD
jgi:hypothetical protein